MSSYFLHVMMSHLKNNSSLGTSVPRGWSQVAYPRQALFYGAVRPRANNSAFQGLMGQARSQALFTCSCMSTYELAACVSLTHTWVYNYVKTKHDGEMLLCFTLLLNIQVKTLKIKIQDSWKSNRSWGVLSLSTGLWRRTVHVSTTNVLRIHNSFAF